ncbi:MAG: hypothetical protein AAGB05_18380 [Pseudomonadota bacterium]
MCVSALAAFPLPAQETETLPGAELYLDFSSGVEISDNYERLENPTDTSFALLNSVALTFDSVTRSQRFTASAGFTFEAGSFPDDPDGDGRDIDNPFVDIAYTLQNRDTLLSFSGRYAERENGFDEQEIVDADDIVVDQGTRSDLTLAANLVLGRTAPLSFSSDLFYRDTQYFDTEDPTLSDEIFYSTTNTLTFNLSRTTSVFVTASYFERDEDDSTETFETNAATRMGVSFENASGLTASFSAGYSVNEVERTVDGDTETTREDRPVAALSFSQARPNGTIDAGLDQVVNEEGRRTSVDFGRSLELPRGSLSMSLGITTADYDDSVRGIGSLEYEHFLPRGTLNLSFSQRVVDDSDDEEDTLITTAGLSWTRPLTSVSSFGLDINLSATEAVDADEADRQRASLTLNYNHALTEDWNLNTGYRHSTFRESGEGPIIENAVFAFIERRFDIRP